MPRRIETPSIRLAEPGEGEPMIRFEPPRSPARFTEDSLPRINGPDAPYHIGIDFGRLDPELVRDSTTDIPRMYIEPQVRAHMENEVDHLVFALHESAEHRGQALEGILSSEDCSRLRHFLERINDVQRQGLHTLLEQTTDTDQIKAFILSETFRTAGARAEAPLERDPFAYVISNGDPDVHRVPFTAAPPDVLGTRIEPPPPERIRELMDRIRDDSFCVPSTSNRTVETGTSDSFGSGRVPESPRPEPAEDDEPEPERGREACKPITVKGKHGTYVFSPSILHAFEEEGIFAEIAAKVVSEMIDAGELGKDVLSSGSPILKYSDDRRYVMNRVLSKVSRGIDAKAVLRPQVKTGGNAFDPSVDMLTGLPVGQ